MLRAIVFVSLILATSKTTETQAGPGSRTPDRLESTSLIWRGRNYKAKEKEDSCPQQKKKPNSHVI